MKAKQRCGGTERRRRSARPASLTTRSTMVGRFEAGDFIQLSDDHLRHLSVYAGRVARRSLTDAVDSLLWNAAEPDVDCWMPSHTHFDAPLNARIGWSLPRPIRCGRWGVTKAGNEAVAASLEGPLSGPLNPRLGAFAAFSARQPQCKKPAWDRLFLHVSRFKSGARKVLQNRCSTAELTRQINGLGKGGRRIRQPAWQAHGDRILRAVFA